MKGSFAKYLQDQNTQVTFYYIDGNTETISIPISPEEFQAQIAEIFTQPWLTFHMIDQTVSICTSRIVKLEVRPVMTSLAGPGIYPDCQKITTLERNAAR